MSNKEAIESIRCAFASGKVMWKTHAKQRMLEREIHRSDVKAVVDQGEVIESYEDNKPFPAYLIIGESEGRVMHVLAAWNQEERTAYMITAYEPDKNHFESDMKTRKKREDNG